MEMFGKNIFGDVGVAGLLDLLELPYTGGGPGNLYLQQDKALAKKILAFDGILYPDFAVFTRDADLEARGSLRMPLFIKPLRTDASIGIGSNALVHNAQEMMERVNHILQKVKDSALAEEYIEGREFYLSVLGNHDATAFPPIEMDFSGLAGRRSARARFQGEMGQAKCRVQGHQGRAGRDPRRAARQAAEGVA